MTSCVIGHMMGDGQVVGKPKGKSLSSHMTKYIIVIDRWYFYVQSYKLMG